MSELIVGLESGVAYGTADAPLPDWRSSPEQDDPDDEELETTPSDVVAILGFDPKELKE